MKIYEGDLKVRDARIALVVARFNNFIVEHLEKGAIDTLVRHGVNENSIHIVRVPGAFEMPVTVQRLALSKQYDAIVALGCVIRGGTPHFEYVAGECARGLGQAAANHQVPVSFGVLTTDTIEQAIERAGTKAGNKGVDAAMSALEMISLFRNLDV